MADQRGGEERVRAALAALEAERDRWQAMLERLTADERAAPRTTCGWTIRVVVAHLYAWQQVSNARLEAALHGGAPELPDWLEGAHPESDDELQRFNDRIYQRHRERRWQDVVARWRDGFDHLLERARALPVGTLAERGGFSWLSDHPLVAVLEGTLEHHREHWDRHVRRWVDGLDAAHGASGPA